MTEFVLVTREDFFEGEKLWLCWRKPRCVAKTLSDYVFCANDLRNRKFNDIHENRIKVYRNADLNEETIISHVLSSETGMPVARFFLSLVDQDVELFDAVCVKSLSESKNTLEPLARVYEDISKF